MRYGALKSANRHLANRTWVLVIHDRVFTRQQISVIRQSSFIPEDKLCIQAEGCGCTEAQDGRVGGAQGSPPPSPRASLKSLQMAVSSIGVDGVVVRVRWLGIVEIPIVDAAAVRGAAVAGGVMLLLLLLILLVISQPCVAATAVLVLILVLVQVLVLGGGRGGVLDAVGVVPAAAALALMTPHHDMPHVDAAPREARQVTVIVAERVAIRDPIAPACVLLVAGVALRLISLLFGLLPCETVSVY